MDFFFGTSAAVNGFDQFGHYLRTFGLVTTCTTITTLVLGECDAHFGGAAELSPASTASDEPTAKAERFRRSDRGSEEVRRAPERRPTNPAPVAPRPESDVQPHEGATEGELRPAPQTDSSGVGLRAGRELLRFLMEDGS
jgi:hypothetical protein